MLINVTIYYLPRNTICMVIVIHTFDILEEKKSQHEQNYY